MNNTVQTLLSLSLCSRAEYRCETRKHMIRLVILGGKPAVKTLKKSNVRVTSTHYPRLKKEALFLSMTLRRTVLTLHGTHAHT